MRRSLRVRRMQTKLHRWAADDPGRRFGDLFNLVCDPAFLVVAWERVSANTGSPDRWDGQGHSRPDRDPASGLDAFLDQIRDSLKSGEFTPGRGAAGDDPQGRAGKFRRLGYPAPPTDRVVQAGLKLLVLRARSSRRTSNRARYGFRPNRRAQDAIAEIHHFGPHATTIGSSRPTSRRVSTR